jgi:hypothetical protein
MVSMCTTSFKIKFVHFASIMYLSVLYASHDKEPAISLGSIARWVFLMETERDLSVGRNESFK